MHRNCLPTMHAAHAHSIGFSFKLVRIICERGRVLNHKMKWIAWTGDRNSRTIRASKIHIIDKNLTVNAQGKEDSFKHLFTQRIWTTKKKQIQYSNWFSLAHMVSNFCKWITKYVERIIGRERVNNNQFLSEYLFFFCNTCWGRSFRIEIYSHLDIFGEYECESYSKFAVCEVYMCLCSLTTRTELDTERNDGKNPKSKKTNANENRDGSEL